MAIPADRNVVQKEAEKKLKYKSLCVEVKRMCNIKCVIVPVIIGATGMGAEVGGENLGIMLGKHSVDLVQKAAVIGT